MIGQSFAPLGDPNNQPRPQLPSGISGAQEPIRILNLRMPRVQGSAAPAPQALLNSPGASALPDNVGPNPTIAAILNAVLGHLATQQQSAAGAPGGGPSPGGQPPQPPRGPYTPAVHFQPPPGGTAGPGPQPPYQPPPPQPPQFQRGFDVKNPMGR